MASTSTAMSLRVLVLLPILFSLCWRGGALRVNVTQTGDFTVSRNDGVVWLRSAPPFFVINNITYSAADSTLTLLGVNTTQTGTSTVHSIYYRANDTDITASVSVSNYDFLLFNVTFPNGANGTQATSPDDVICGFPGFLVDPPPARVGYLSYGLASLGAAAGRWERGHVQVRGGRLGSGPLLLFDPDNNAVITAPASAFTLASLRQDATSVHWGIMGAVTQLPPGFQYSVVVMDSDGGIGVALSLWAFTVKSGLLTSPQGSDPVRDDPELDDVLGTLGYWTGPGAAYSGGPEPGKTYEDTLVDISRDASNATDGLHNLPYRHVEVDSWWYEKGQHGGVKEWTSPPSVLPHGISGLYNSTQWPVVAACGVWDTDSPYDTNNGGRYTFLTAPTCSLPADPAFWDYLFNQSSKDGVRGFLQTDMEEQYLCMTSNGSDVDSIMTWLSQVNVSAAEHKMAVMYSGAPPRLVMEAAFRHPVPPVVQVGSPNVTDAGHWRVGVANLLANGLGVKPFFGTVRSHGNQTAPTTQLSPVFYNLLATLTGGPVAIGDELGKSDRDVIDRCCSSRGDILSSSHPVQAIDPQIQQMAWGGTAGATGEVWSTFTANSLNSQGYTDLYHGLLVATGMTRPFNVTPTSARLVFQPQGGGLLYSPTKLFGAFNPYVLHDFREDNPFTLDCRGDDFCLYHVAPVIPFRGQEVVIMGDLTKWVPMSPRRVLRVEVGEAISVFTRGDPGERVFIYFHVDGRLRSLEHRIEADGTGVVKYELSPQSGAPAGSARCDCVIALCALSVFAYVKVM